MLIYYFFQELFNLNLLADKFLDLIVGITQAIIIAFIVRHYYSVIKNNRHLKKCGINSIESQGEISTYQLNNIFKNAIEIKLCYVTGIRLFNQYKNDISDAAKRLDDKLQIIICDESFDMIKPIFDIEIKYGLRSPDKTYDTEKLTKMIDLLTSIGINHKNIKLNNKLYNVPYLIALMPEKNYKYTYYAYFNLTIPPRKAVESLYFTAKLNLNDFDIYVDKGHIKESPKNLVVDLLYNFKYLWETLPDANKYINTKQK